MRSLSRVEQRGERVSEPLTDDEIAEWSTAVHIAPVGEFEVSAWTNYAVSRLLATIHALRTEVDRWRQEAGNPPIGGLHDR
jgi:hypothetical protein